MLAPLPDRDADPGGNDIGEGDAHRGRDTGDELEVLRRADPHVRQPAIQGTDRQQEVQEHQRRRGRGQGRKGETPAAHHRHRVERKPQPGGDVGTPGWSSVTPTSSSATTATTATGWLRRNNSATAAAASSSATSQTPSSTDSTAVGGDKQQVAGHHNGVHGARMLEQVAPDPAAAPGGDFSEGRVGLAGRRVPHWNCIDHALSLDGAHEPTTRPAF